MEDINLVKYLKEELTLFGLPVRVDSALRSDECYMVHPDVLDALLQGYRCIQEMPDRIAKIENLYKPRRGFWARLLGY